MNTPRATLSRVLAALLLLQVVLAPALCLARGALAASGAVEICTADGYRLVHLSADGQEQAPTPTLHDGFCLACHGLPQAVAVATPVLPPPAWIRVERAWGAPRLAAPPPAIRGPPGGARAPPSLLS